MPVNVGRRWVLTASLARQISPEGHCTSRLCSGGAFQAHQPSCPLTGSAEMIQAGDLGTSQTHPRDPGEIQNSEAMHVERGHLQSEGTRHRVRAENAAELCGRRRGHV